VLVVAVVLVAIAAVVGERIARDYAEGYIRDELVTAVPGTEPVVTVGDGSVLLQAASGALDSVHVTADGVTFDEVTGNLELTATDVPLDGSSAGSVTAQFDVDEAAVADLVTATEGFETADVTLVDDAIAVGSSFSVFGSNIPLDIRLEPQLGDAGELVLTPATVAVNDAQLSLDELADGPFGSIVSDLVKPQSVCIAEYVPAELGVSDVAIVESALRLTLTGEDVSLDEESLSTLGAC
jgi:hypothetical protein